MKPLIFFLGLLPVCLALPATALDTTKTFNAIRIEGDLRIDGSLDDPVWQQSMIMTDFVQYLPLEGGRPGQRTTVRIVYDNQALYIGAMMYDTAPDSIMKELGMRDILDLNSDYFLIGFDPYLKDQDAWYYGVYASGVQVDYKRSDFTYDAVWQSAVRISDEGWIAELRIPWSAIRFPSKPEQHWSLQASRYIRRNRETILWTQVPSKTNNAQLFWGSLIGINNISPPLRLSFTPYLSSYAEVGPEFQSNGEVIYRKSFSYNAGADVKYGIDERFTLDMTLFPDFGQVASDNKIKNLSYREVTYDENRPFFKESVELFDKNNLFYSRRIGQIPSGYFDAENQLHQGEKLTDNPARSRLLHALKLSGRTDNGLGIGFFNAVTDNTYATASDSLGRERKILTEPLTNFSAIVLEQDLKNNSEIYFINTNVTRDKKYNDANVTGSGFVLSNKENTLALEATGTLSQAFSVNDSMPPGNYNTNLGYQWSLALSKMGGTFNYAIARTVYDSRYFTSDMGYQTINNKVLYEAQIKHNRHQPWKIFRNSYNNLFLTHATHFVSGKTVDSEINLNLFATLLNYVSVFAGGGTSPLESYDYFEPRVNGRFHKKIRYYYAFAGISTDYRKKVALDLSFNISNFIDRYVSEGYNIRSTLRYRMSDRLTLKWSTQYNFDPYNLGFADITENDTIIYGTRYLNTYVNQLGISWIFNKDMYVTLNVRHYWLTARYRNYLTLQENGELTENYTYNINNDFSYNAFNIDLLYSWRFAPGSDIIFSYKNAIEKDEVQINSVPSYDSNFKKVLNSPQTNSVSLKILFYLDYNYLRKKQRTKI